MVKVAQAIAKIMARSTRQGDYQEWVNAWGIGIANRTLDDRIRDREDIIDELKGQKDAFTQQAVKQHQAILEDLRAVKRA